jgi:hypothetical protein
MECGGGFLPPLSVTSHERFLPRDGKRRQADRTPKRFARSVAAVQKNYQEA